MWPNCSKSVRRNGARHTCRNSGTNESRGIAACGCNTGALIPTLPPSSSNALGVYSLPCASSNKLPVHRSPGGNRLIVRAFTTPLAVPTSTVFDPSIGPKYLPSSNRESKGPKRRLDGCTGIHHTRSPNCAKGGNSTPSHISFVCCLAVTTDRKTCDAHEWHMTQATSTNHGPQAPPPHRLIPPPT